MQLVFILSVLYVPISGFSFGKSHNELNTALFATPKWTPNSIIGGSKNNKLFGNNKPTIQPAIAPIVVPVPEVAPKPVTPNGSITIPDVIAISNQNQPAVKKSTKKTFDGLAALSYVGATATQWTLIVSFLHLLQLKALPFVQKSVTSNPKLPASLPTGIVTTLFFFLSLRSRLFSPLDNSRPAASKEDPVFKDRLRPWWQPPPLAFPIIWSTISILRTISSTLVWKATGTLLSVPTFAFILHLCIGDTWNTINNVEKRLGTSVLGVLFVLASVYNLVYQYYQTLPLAGKIIAPSAVWLSVATFLIYSIWRLNSQLFDRPSLFPSKEEGPACKWKMPFSR